MAGIGDYKKTDVIKEVMGGGDNFQLKSQKNVKEGGFPMMGSSPANIKSFGVGQGASPWQADQIYYQKDLQQDVTESEEEKGDNFWKKTAKIAAEMASEGLSRVYGGPSWAAKIDPKTGKPINEKDDKDDADDTDDTDDKTSAQILDVDGGDSDIDENIKKLTS